MQKLHEQWREIGPVANEYKEPLWDRFREASSKINKRHQEYFDNIKEEQKRNLELKTQLCVRTEELSEASPTTRKEWNKASEQLIEIQKVWKTIGFAPKKDNTKIYERFRTACDRFFENKRNFYLQTKAEMENNLHLRTKSARQRSRYGSEQWKRRPTADRPAEVEEIGPFRAAIRCRLETLPTARPFLRAQAVFLDRPIQGKPVEKAGIARGTGFSVEEQDKGSSDQNSTPLGEIGFVPIKQGRDQSGTARWWTISSRGSAAAERHGAFQAVIELSEGGDRASA
ncbi:MAG: DUF349 domain-containing protein [Alistipes ihumii]